MKIQCNVCEAAEANVLCCADEAALCWSCDQKVHAAKSLLVSTRGFRSLPRLLRCPSVIFVRLLLVCVLVVDWSRWIRPSGSVYSRTDIFSFCGYSVMVVTLLTKEEFCIKDGDVRVFGLAVAVAVARSGSYA
ncbi:UNVERIFIED_CONTAM: B-box zinc finger protein 22 [Sesamum latifolium]|uniref:B-box zinc finger protein 22 n=1 Tax=Sesamum latifolium TaxID=2727402 RepID=A0AAW2TQ18_9LAMI